MQTVHIITSSIALVPSLIGFFKHRTLGRPEQIIWLYALLTLLTELLSFACKSYSINNLPLFHVFTIVQFYLLAEFFKCVSQKRWHKTYSFLQLSFAGFAIFNAMFLQPISIHNTYPRIVSAILLILMSLFYFYERFERDKNPLRTQPGFYVSVGVLLYFSVSMTIIFLGNYLQGVSLELYYNVWLIQWIVNIILYLFLAVALWIYKPR